MLDLTNQTFGRLTALRPTGERRHGQVMWECLCSCGTLKAIKSWYLANGRTRSCGCLQREGVANSKPGTKHGKSRTTEARLYYSCKERATKRGLDFNLVLDDIVIPSHCPVLGLPLYVSAVQRSHNSPTVDRIDNTKGYTRDNIHVISSRANLLKNDGTVKELKAIVLYMETYKEK